MKRIIVNPKGYDRLLEVMPKEWEKLLIDDFSPDALLCPLGEAYLLDTDKFIFPSTPKEETT